MIPMSARSIPTLPSHLPVPPPRFDLHDGDALVGWIDGRAIGFHGFGNEVEAAHAAWIAYRTMTRRFARDLGQRPPPIDGEPVRLQRKGGVEHVLAGYRPIAQLVRPGSDGASGRESFGFELQVPVPASELTMRSTAYLVYHALRRSGTRWAMWVPARVAPTPAEREPARADATGDERARAGGVAERHDRPRSTAIPGLALAILAVLAVLVLPAVSLRLAVVLLAGAVAIGMIARPRVPAEST
jgi:hypothetical protein